MTRLFILLYVGVLAVLSVAWYIHGAVSKRRAEAEKARVFEEAHGGGARLVAQEMDATPQEKRGQVMAALRERFDYPVSVVSLDDLPNSVRRRFANGEDVAYFSPDEEPDMVAGALDNTPEAVVLGPFPDYRLMQIEESVGGWMRLTAEKLNDAEPDQRPAILESLRDHFDFPLEIASREAVPPWSSSRIVRGEDIVFYRQDEAVDRWFAATPLSNGSEVVRFGPFPSFERIEQKAATTTLALVLLPAAFAIALLLRPVALQLRRVEHAAKAIAGGDLSARVDERRVRAARPLAQAFNNMAGRTESLVRTQRELLQAVSHELRTPLSRMKFAIDLIATAKDDDERNRRLESLDNATEELDELVGELLTYVRMETTEPKLEMEPIRLKDTLGVLIPKHAALHPSVVFDVTHDSETENTLILADRTGFQRAIGNLLSNAGRFANRRVVVHAEANNGVITVYVDDDGSGIPPADRERAFEPFSRLENDSANGHGVGLGLALVKRIVTQHGGTVEALSSPLGGCRMRTNWPIDGAASDRKLR